MVFAQLKVIVILRYGINLKVLKGIVASLDNAKMIVIVPNLQEHNFVLYTFALKNHIVLPNHRGYTNVKMSLVTLLDNVTSLKAV